MNVVDTRSLDKDIVEASCDVCIVGAGAAGSYLALRLTQMGLTVIILEAGGRVFGDGASVGIEAEFDGAVYRGATEGRYFGMGGSTTRWGGYLVPHTKRDIRQNQSGEFDSWCHIVETVKQRSANVMSNLGLKPEASADVIIRNIFGNKVESFQNSGLEIVMGTFLPFRRKNMASLLKEASKTIGQLTIFLHAVTTDWQLRDVPGGGAGLRTVTARAGKNNVRVSARSFVVASGAIESARILLEIQQQANANPFRQGAAVGRYLGDHLSSTIADVPSNDWSQAVKIFAPRFVHGWMRSFRFLDSNTPADASRAFVHFIFEHENAGFELAKKLMGGLQARALPKVSPSEIIQGTAGLMALGFNRYARSRLYVDSKTPVHLQLDIEQLPDYDNSIRLGDQCDASGRRMPVIKWEVKSADYDAIHETASRILKLWPGKQQDLPELHARQGDPRGQKPYDAYHPVGVCRMGTAVEDVVDPELRVHGMANLAVLSTAVFPTAGTANPTFSMLCLGDALADRLAKEKAH